MKILLLNDNPVVNKLVTLSAQKTSDELDVADSIDSIQSSEYDLIVVDDGMYNDEIFAELKSKIVFSKSLYICSRDAAAVETFSSTIKKPFLPTDLVELFLKLSKEVNTSSSSKEETTTDLDEVEEFGIEEVEEELELASEKIDELEEFEDEKELEIGEDIELDDLSLDDDDLNISLDDELDDLDEELSLDDDYLEEGESVLDDEEAQKVKDLLDETEAYNPQMAANELGLPVEEIEEFIEDFINQAEEFRDELYSSLESNDLENIQNLSHKLKGVAANLRMQKVLEAITVVNSSSDKSEIESSLDDFYKSVAKLSETDTGSLSDEEELAAIDELEEELELDEEDLELDDLDEDLLLDDEEVSTDDLIEEEKTADLDELEEELELDEEDLELDEEDLELDDLDDDLLIEEEAVEVAEPETAETEEEKTADLDELEVAELEEELDLESQIQNAVEELSDEDLESELDEETLLEIATGEIDDFDSLTSNDLKLAIGEEVNTEELEIGSTDTDTDKLKELNQGATASQEIKEVPTNTVEALENLLAALKNKNVAASMKGMKININITIGED